MKIMAKLFDAIQHGVSMANVLGMEEFKGGDSPFFLTIQFCLHLLIFQCQFFYLPRAPGFWTGSRTICPNLM